jgi:hypothetical protein
VRDPARRAPASLSPVLSNSSIAITTALIGSYGTAALAGYGVAARLEYIMIPIVFGFGTALTTLVATNLGAGQHERALARHLDRWCRGGADHRRDRPRCGARAPSLWMNHFSADPAVLAFGSPVTCTSSARATACSDLGLRCFSPRRVRGKMFWPLTGSVARLVTVAVGGWLAIHVWQLPVSGLFVVIAAG